MATKDFKNLKYSRAISEQGRKRETKKVRLKDSKCHSLVGAPQMVTGCVLKLYGWCCGAAWGGCCCICLIATDCGGGAPRLPGFWGACCATYDCPECDIPCFSQKIEQNFFFYSETFFILFISTKILGSFFQFIFHFLSIIYFFHLQRLWRKE